MIDFFFSSCLHEIFIHKTYGEKYQNLRVLDIGAHKGESTLYFLLQGAKAVAAVEPFPDFVEKIRERIGQNHFQDRVLLIPVAIGGKNGTAGFTYLPDAPECSFLNPEQGGRIQVRTITFDALLSEIGWEEVDVAKVDCEGCEYELFSMLLTRHSPKSGCG